MLVIFLSLINGAGWLTEFTFMYVFFLCRDYGR
jgi:hypothetical protein